MQLTIPNKNFENIDIQIDNTFVLIKEFDMLKPLARLRFLYRSDEIIKFKVLDINDEFKTILAFSEQPLKYSPGYKVSQGKKILYTLSLNTFQNN